MSGYKNFAVVGAGLAGSFVVRQFLKDKAVGRVNEVVVLTRQVSLVGLTLIHIPLAHQSWQGSKTSIEGDAKLIPVDYSDKESIKRALTGIDVVVSVIAQAALGLQVGIAEAAKEAGVKLFVPSEFGIPSEAATEGHIVEKAEILGQLKAVGMPYALFYTGAFADFIWDAYVAFSYAVSSDTSTHSGAVLWVLTSQVGKYTSAAMVTSSFRSPPGPT